jgi:hypothetical protein
MTNKDHSSNSESPLSDEIKSLLDETYTYNNINSSRRYSGDGTWIESHPIFALVEAQDKAVAVSKGAAALENRDGRPDPLFDHEASDTYDLLITLDSIPLTVQGTPWERANPLTKINDVSDKPIQHLLDVSPFDEESSCVVSEWGNIIESKAGLREELASFSSQGWLIAGIALAPLGAGDGNEEYIGNTYEVYCPKCGEPEQAECINVTHDKQEGVDAGIWVCQHCGEDYRGTHPRGPARLSRKDPQP